MTVKLADLTQAPGTPETHVSATNLSMAMKQNNKVVTERNDRKERPG